MATQPPSYCQIPAEPSASTMATMEDVPPRKQDVSPRDNMIEEAPHALAQPSMDDPSNKRPELFSDSKAAAGYISAAMATVAAASGLPADTARSIVGIITYTVNSVTSAPAAKAQITAAIIVAAITDHIANQVADPGEDFRALDRFEDAIMRDVPGSTADFCSVILKINFLLKFAKLLPQDHIAVPIVSAVTTVANAIANSPAGTRLAVAAAYITSAKRAADMVSNAVPENRWSEINPGKYKQCHEKRCCAGAANTGACRGAVQKTNLRAALGALREYTTSVGHLEAAQALGAVVAGRRQDATCTCKDDPTRCEGILGVHRLLTELDMAKNSHEMMLPGGEAARVLGIAVAGAEGAAGVTTPPLERLHAIEARERSETFLQAVRDIDERLAKLEAAGSDSADHSP
ncbi:hypothetical protein F5144DRAFT_601950 [Chaetomium tenue]|uniref:Uncharacterized protein n=1 Tax=Chaetomium tenue TaxID=1854479 RepID=A0ACB7PDJ6_9PEZI|nr:hypothetical protein F5144DRAFT_601950 [Chaetomium globosum]